MDPNWDGITLPIPGNFQFHTVSNTAGINGEKMRLTSDGDLGIGTLEPDEKLHVVGTIKATDINFTGIPSYGSNADANADVNLESGDVYRVNSSLRIKL